VGKLVILLTKEKEDMDVALVVKKMAGSSLMTPLNLCLTMMPRCNVRKLNLRKVIALLSIKHSQVETPKDDSDEV
jgi:hypothetical protein